MNRIWKRIALCAIVFALAFGCTACFLNAQTEPSTTASSSTTKAQETIDPLVSDVLRDFYTNDLRAVILHSGIQNADGADINCDYSMLKKSVFADYDADGQKELILLYDVSEKTGDRGRELAAFIDEKDGKAIVASTEDASYGVSSSDEAHILTQYDGRVCKVRFINKSAYEAVLIDQYVSGGWKTVLSAYRHNADHDGVKLENGSCYIDHSGGELYEAAVGKTYYSKEKFLNFRTPADNFDSLVTNLLASTLLP